MRETRVRSLGQEDPLEKDMATPLQYSCLENPMDGGAWWATYTVRVAELDMTERLHYHFLVGEEREESRFGNGGVGTKDM